MKKQLKHLQKNVSFYVTRAGLLKFNKPFKIMLNYHEYMQRCRHAQQVAPTTCYDISSLKAQGYLVIEPKPSLLNPLLAYCRAKFADATDLAPRKGKVYFKDILSMEDYDPRNILFRFALEEKLLATASAYLGGAPFLESIELIYSMPHPSEPLQSQLWHVDATDDRILKVFVYIEDVETEHGPFSLLPLPESKKVPFEAFRKQHYLDDAAISQYVDLEKTVAVKGPAGTTFMVDSTNCYHFGSRCQKPRLAYVAYFTTGFSYYDRHYPHKRLQWKEMPHLSEVTLTEAQQLALGLK